MLGEQRLGRCLQGLGDDRVNRSITYQDTANQDTVNQDTASKDFVTKAEGMK